MTDWQVLFVARMSDVFGPKHAQHDAGQVCELRIVLYRPTTQYYLIHYDSVGRELADTEHDCLEDAMEQAEFEYGLEPDRWLPVQ